MTTVERTDQAAGGGEMRTDGSSFRRLIAAAVVVSGVGCQRASEDMAAPAARAHHDLAFDAAEGSLYLIGGSTGAGGQYRYFRDVWRWSGTRWTPGEALPFPRASHRVVYDTDARRLVLFGGQFGTAVRSEGVIWARTDEGWSALGGLERAGRDDAGLCYDRTRRRLVVFGGWDERAEYRDELWEWDGDELRLVDAPGPPARAGPGFAWHAGRSACVLFGGRGPDGYLSDTWAWDGRRWEPLEGPAPSSRWFTGFTSHRSGVVLFGGRGPGADLDDTWILSDTGWSRREVDASPTPRSLAAMASTGESVILFGGRSTHGDGFTDLGDTWELTDSWRRVSGGEGAGR